MPDRVLVTGATGFLGSAVVRVLEGSGVDVRTSGRRGDPRAAFRDYVAADLSEPEALSRAVTGMTAIVHAAGLAHQFGRVENGDFFEVNVNGTVRLLEAAASAGISRVVLISSVSVYGGGRNEPWRESDSCVPSGAYAESRHRAETEATQLAMRHGIALTVLRMATVYGEGDPGNVARLIRAIDRGRFLWVGTGSNRKSLIHRDDAARAILMALRQYGMTGVFNVSGAPTPLADIVAEIARSLGRPIPSLRVPDVVARSLATMSALAAPILPGTVRFRETLETWLREDVFDVERFRTATGFEPKVALPEGIAREVRWYLSQNTRR